MRRLLLALVVTCACAYSLPNANASADTPTADDVCKQFRAADLQAMPCRRMNQSDWGVAGRPRNFIEGRRFVVESLCDEYEDPCDAGGRVMRFKTMSSLRAQKAYYDGFGKKGDVLFSWTFVNRRRLILVQINGDLREKLAMRYRAVLTSL